ncbi:glutamate synthase-related protein [Sulfobacillus thermosulfidooxidans]|nr:glutamate synthase-related protein [Sulfobacillus thermosulfidooxidans]
MNSQGAKPGVGGLLLGDKNSPEISPFRDLPVRSKNFSCDSREAST